MTQDEIIEMARFAGIRIDNFGFQGGYIEEFEAFANLVAAKALAQPEQDIAALVTGMEVSIDVSTGDHDSGNRLFGGVTLVQECLGTKHGLILLVQEPKANFKEDLAQPEQELVADDFFKMIVDRNPKPFPPPQRTWVGLAAEDRLTAKYMQDAPNGIEAVIDYIEAKLKERNT